MSEIQIVTKPEERDESKKQKEEDKNNQRQDPQHGKDHFKKLYGHGALPGDSLLSRAAHNIHRLAGLREIKEIFVEYANHIKNGFSGGVKEKKPFQPDAFDVTVTDHQNLKNGVKEQAFLPDALSRIAERPPVSVFDKKIDVRDRLIALRNTLTKEQIKQTLNSSKERASTGTEDNITKIENEINSVK